MSSPPHVSDDTADLPTGDKGHPTDAFSELCKTRLAKRVRGGIIDLLEASGGGHYGGSLSAVDLLVAIFVHGVEARARQGFIDRFVLSKGHAAPAYYVLLHALGRLNAPLTGYADFGSALQGHPDMTTEPGVDFSTGSLGQGLSVGLGMALALRKGSGRAWVLVGDGECQEGQIWEAAMLAGRIKISNLAVIIDANGRQEWGFRGGDTQEPVENLAAKWTAFGWRVLECDGHDPDALEAAVNSIADERVGPVALIARTIKGRGVSFIEADPDRFHCSELSEPEIRIARAELAT